MSVGTNEFNNAKELKKELKQNTKKSNELEKQLQNLQSSLNEVNYKFGVECKERKRYEDENVNLRNRVSELLGVNSGLESKNELLKIRSEELEGNWVSARQEAETRKMKLKELRNKLKEMQKNIEDEREDLLFLKKEAEELKFNIHELNEENERLNQDNQMHEEEKKDIQQEVEHLNQLLEEQNQRLSKQENALGNMGSKSDIDFLESELKKKSKKMKQLKQANQELLDKMTEVESRSQAEKNIILQEKEEILSELEMYRTGQVHELSIVENQVNLIEQELNKLKDQNKTLQMREQEILKELRSSEAAKMKYKEKCCELKEQVNDLEAYVSETEGHLKSMIEQQKRDMTGIKSSEEKNQVLSSRLRALDDIQHLIKAHKNV